MYEKIFKKITRYERLSWNAPNIYELLKIGLSWNHFTNCSWRQIIAMSEYLSRLLSTNFNVEVFPTQI